MEPSIKMRVLFTTKVDAKRESMPGPMDILLPAVPRVGDEIVVKNITGTVVSVRWSAIHPPIRVENRVSLLVVIE
jgi:hypothetical protein